MSYPTSSSNLSSFRPCGCLAERVCAELAVIAEPVAAQVTGRRGRLTRPALGAVIPETDPVVDAEFERLLGKVLHVVRCHTHRPVPTPRVSPADTRRLHAAVLAYVTSDQAHRPTRLADLRRVMAWAIADHPRELTRHTPAKLKAERTAHGFRDTVTGQPLLSRAQADIFKFVCRGLNRARSTGEAGEPLAAQIVLGQCDPRDGVAYIRTLDQRTRRTPLAANHSPCATLSDAALQAEIAAFADKRTWARGPVEAHHCYTWMTTRAREILTTSLDAHTVDQDDTPRDVHIEDSVFGAVASMFTHDTELAAWQDIVDDGYHIGTHTLTPTEQATIDARIAFLRDLT